MLADDLRFFFDRILWVLLSFHNIFKKLFFLPLNIPIENCMLIRRYDWFFWVIQFSPLLLQPRCHTIPFMYWSNPFLQLFRDFFFTSHTQFGGCSSFLGSFPLKYVHGLLLLLCFWTLKLLYFSFNVRCLLMLCGAVLLAARLKKQSFYWAEASSSDDS